MMTPYLQSWDVVREEVVGRAAAPVHDVLVLTATAELPVPVGHTQVGLDEGVAHVTVTKDSVEEGLQKEQINTITQQQQQTKRLHYTSLLT